MMAVGIMSPAARTASNLAKRTVSLKQNKVFHYFDAGKYLHFQMYQHETKQIIIVTTVWNTGETGDIN